MKSLFVSIIISYLEACLFRLAESLSFVVKYHDVRRNSYPIREERIRFGPISKRITNLAQYYDLLFMIATSYFVRVHCMWHGRLSNKECTVIYSLHTM
jgi:hypothetical protein